MKHVLLWIIAHSRTFLIIYGVAFCVILAIIFENMVSPGYTQDDAYRWMYKGNIALVVLLVAIALMVLLRYLYFEEILQLG